MPIAAVDEFVGRKVRAAHGPLEVSKLEARHGHHRAGADRIREAILMRGADPLGFLDVIGAQRVQETEKLLQELELESFGFF